jgi:hypothetical protein
VDFGGGNYGEIYVISIIYLGPTPEPRSIALGKFDLPIFHFGVKMAALSAKQGLVLRNFCYKPITFPGPTPDYEAADIKLRQRMPTSYFSSGDSSTGMNQTHGCAPCNLG